MKYRKLMLDEVHPFIFQAVEMMQEQWGKPCSINIELVSKMVRTEPTEYAPNGLMGAIVRVGEKDVFLGLESMAEMMVTTPFGHSIIDEFMFEALKDQLTDI